MSEDVPFPPERIEQYRRDGLWTGETLGDALRRAALAHPDRAALITVDTRLTHAELDELSESFAAGLLATTPLRTGDRVMFQLGNEAETVNIPDAYADPTTAASRPGSSRSAPCPSTASARSASSPSTPARAVTSCRPISATATWSASGPGSSAQSRVWRR